MCAMFSDLCGCGLCGCGCIEKMLAAFLQLYMFQDLSRHGELQSMRSNCRQQQQVSETLIDCAAAGYVAMAGA